MAPRIPNVRITPDDETVRAQLGLLRDFWELGQVTVST